MRLHEVKELFQIVEKKKLNDAVVMVRIAAPLIAKKVLPGQFIIFRLDEFGERVPLTVADYDREGGTITLIFQIAGETTRQFSLLEAGDSILDLAGPLGVPTELPEGTKSVCVIGGGVGCAIAYPQATKTSSFWKTSSVHAVTTCISVQTTAPMAQRALLPMCCSSSWNRVRSMTLSLPSDRFP